MTLEFLHQLFVTITFFLAILFTMSARKAYSATPPAVPRAWKVQAILLIVAATTAFVIGLFKF